MNPAVEDPTEPPATPSAPSTPATEVAKAPRERTVPELLAGEARPSEKPARGSEPAAVILATDLYRWIITKTGKFPKSVRYGLGQRIESAHLDVLEELINAQYARGHDRTRALEVANRRLQVARHLVRVSFELRLIPERSAVYCAQLQVNLGTQVGAWRKASASMANSSRSCVTQPT